MVLGVGMESGRNGLGAEVGGIGGGSRGMGGKFSSKGSLNDRPSIKDVRMAPTHASLQPREAQHRDGDGSTVSTESPARPPFLDPSKSARYGPPPWLRPGLEGFTARTLIVSRKRHCERQRPKRWRRHQLDLERQRNLGGDDGVGPKRPKRCWRWQSRWQRRWMRQRRRRPRR
jgi:hypothetical protein